MSNQGKLAPRIILLGDTLTGARYISVAKAQLVALRRVGVPSNNRVIELEGVEIRLALKSPLDEIRITAAPKQGCSGWYMDSGLVYWGWAVGPLKYTPGKMYEGAALAQNIVWGKISSGKNLSVRNPADTKQPVVDGDISGAFSVKLPPEPTLVQQAADPNAETNWIAACTALNDGLVTKKLMVNFPGCLPSLFSGKARLLVQAVMGKKYDAAENTAHQGSDWHGLQYHIPTGKTINTPSGSVPEVLQATIQSAAGYAPGTGLYTDADFGYWLIDTNWAADTATITPLKLSICGVAAIAAMKKDTAAVDRITRAPYEAIALSTAFPDVKNKFTISGLGLGPVGAIPLFYGWSWTWGGTKADVIVNIPGSYPITGGTQLYYDAQQVSLSVLRDTTSLLAPGKTEKDRWKITKTVGSTQRWWPDATYQTVWVPYIDDTGVPAGIIPFGATNSTAYSPPIFGSATIYGFYDVADKWQPFSIGCSSIGAATGTVTENSGWDSTPFTPLSGPYQGYYSFSPPTGGTHSTKTLNNAVGTRYSLGGETFDSQTLGGGSGWTVTVGGTPAPGGTWAGGSLPEFHYGGACTYVPSSSPYVSPWGNGLAASCFTTGAISDPRISAPYSTYAGYYMYDAVRVDSAPVTIQQLNYTSSTKYGNAAIAVPYGDCTTVYVAAQVYVQDITGTGSNYTAQTITALTASYWTNHTPNAAVSAAEGSTAAYPYLEPNTLTYTGSVPGTTTTTTTLNRIRCYSYSGVQAADPSYMTPTFMACSYSYRLNYGGIYTNADMFYTTSSAVRGDVIGKTFTTGGYKTTAGDANAKCFIGFA